MTLAYLDASAFVKTINMEPESERLLGWLRDWPNRTSSALLRTEALRAAHRYGIDAVTETRVLLGDLTLVALDDAILNAAGELPVNVRSPDAIHLATARALGSDVGVLVTYDDRMSRAATEIGIEVVSP